MRFIVAAICILAGCSVGGAAELVTEEFMIPSGDPGIELYVRNKHPANAAELKAEKIVLYVHGSSQASETTFDLRVDGASWMDLLAQDGWDVYLMDVRGYGRSSRPPEMSEPPDANPPLVTTDVAVADAGRAIEFIRKRRGAGKISLIGWAWGTVTVAAYAAQNADKVDRLVLYAPAWVRPPRAANADEPRLPAYWSWTVEEARKFLEEGAPPDRESTLMPAAWFAAWKAAALATDPVGARQSPPVVRTPNGAALDSRRYWAAGKSYYDGGKIRSPTLVIYGAWDATMPRAAARGVIDTLTGAEAKRLVEIAEGTHFVMLEQNRMQLIRAVQLFLDETGLGK